MDNLTAISYFTSTASDLSEFIPLFTWIMLIREAKPYTLLGVYFLISAFIKLFTLITAELYINNMPAFHVLACVEIMMLFSFFSMITYKKISVRWLALLFIINAGNTLFFQSIFTFNSIAWTINMLALIILGLLYLYRLYKTDEDYAPLEKRPDFIITAGFLIYASGSLFTYLMGTSILSGEPEGFFHNAWIIQSVSNISKNVIVSYGLWLMR